MEGTRDMDVGETALLVSEVVGLRPVEIPMNCLSGPVQLELGHLG